MIPIHVGGFARIPFTREPLTVIAIDGEDTWLKDDVGTKLTLPTVDLEYVPYSVGAAWIKNCQRVAALSDREAADARQGMGETV